MNLFFPRRFSKVTNAAEDSCGVAARKRKNFAFSIVRPGSYGTDEKAWRPEVS